MDATTERQRYIVMVSEFKANTMRYLRFLSGERKGQIKTFTHRGAAEVEAGRSYQKVTPTSVVVIMPIGLPGQPDINTLEDRADA